VRRQAEERIALVEERAKRAFAEESNRWLDFLTRAGAILGQSLDQRVTMQAVVQLPIPILADVAALVMPGEEHNALQKCITAYRDTDGPVVEESVPLQSLDRELAAAINRAWDSATAQVNSERAIAFPLRARGNTFAIFGLSRGPS